MKKTFHFLFLILISSCFIYSQNADFNGNEPGSFDYMVPPFAENDLVTTATWSSLPVSPHGVSRTCVAYVRRNDTAYMFQFGGGAGSQYTNVAVFNINTNTWTNSISTMPFQISAGYAIPDGDSVIYVFGGNTPTLGKTLKWTIWGTWTTLTDMPTPATDILCVKYQDTLVYAICGGDGLFGPTVNNAVRLFRMRSATWTSLTPFPVTKSMVGGGIYADTIIATAGWTGSTGSPLTHKGVINPTNPTLITWTAIANYPGAGITRMASHMVQKAGQGAGILCTGGAINGAAYYGGTHLWNFCTGTWQNLPNIPQARSNFRGCGAGDSVFYCASGWIGSNVGTSDKLTFSQIDGTCAIITGTNNNNNSVPNNFSLDQNYPNPFNPATVISYSLPKAGIVKITVSDVMGREVSTLINDFIAAGNYSIEFNAASLSSGIYFYTLSAGDFKETKKMVLVK
jgi:hypothetical protein